MLRPRVATRASTAAPSLSSSSSTEGGEVWSPTIANPRLSAFDRLKEERVSSESVGSCEYGEYEETRSVSAGPLDLQDLVLLKESVGDRGSTDLQDQEYEEDDDEDALKVLFFRQQQLEKKLLRSREKEPEEDQHDDVDQFLTSELRFDIPASASHLSVARKRTKKTNASRAIKFSSQRETVDPSMSALTASIHEQLSVEGSHHHHHHHRRSRHQSNALLPDGVLHLWIYQARQLAFRSHFESMYDRHGLHIRCYLSWRREYLSDVFESRRNVGGNMKNPVWRRDDDHSRNLMRCHFSIPLGSRSSPASLPANTKVVIEIVCGILVVSTAKVSLLEFFQDRSSKSSTEDDDNDDDQDSASGNASGIVSCSPKWYPLIGQDSGLLEMGLEFIPASAFDDDDDEDEEHEEDLAFVLVENNNEEGEYEDELALLDDDSSLYQDDDDGGDPQVQDPSEPNAFEEEYMQLEQRTLTRKMRFECPELHEQFEALAAQHGGESDSEQHSNSDGVVVSNNGKTTMYIPSQCQSNHEHSVGFPVAQNSPNTSVVVVNETALAQHSSPPPSRSDEIMMDEQVFDLFRFGIANEQTNLQNGMHRTSSCASQISQFSWGNSEYSSASMFSRKASTCATDVLAYNELIQDMESSLEAEAAEEAQRGGERRRRRASTSSSTVIPKADGILRLAAPTSEPHPITAAMGVVPNKSSLKKSSFMRTYDASKGDEDSLEDDFHQASSVREQTPKGVVLFDLKSIPERLRVGFERSVSEEHMTGNKKDVNLGRRRSLPVNSLTPPDASQQTPMSLHAAHARGLRNGHSSRPVAIQEHTDEKATNNDVSQEEDILRRKRRSSMYSMIDLHGRRDGTTTRAPGDGSQRQQQQQHGGSRTPARRDRGSTPRPAQHRRNSNASNLVNVGGAVLGVGKFINVGSVPGVVRYVGPANFASGTWIGIELCEKKGKNNGTVKGVEYFSCAPNHGIFIRANRLDIAT
ncbi:hypothetical protein Gpo141_00011688 [Globisporangium polare]